MAEDSLYDFDPNHAAPAIFAAIIGISLIVHTFQNFHYKFWRVTFFMFYGGLVFTAGWIMRTISGYNPTNLNLYIAQTCLVLGGPPIYAAAEYNILGRLMYYLPMHAPLHPGRLIYFFIYLGAAVEGLTGAGAAMMATASRDDMAKVREGGRLVSIALVMQGAVELLFIGIVILIHRRASRAQQFSHNVRRLCIMLYGTSTLIVLRCIFRAIEAFATHANPYQCNSLCQFVRREEWYLYVFEGLPMALYTIWLNIMHPGRYLPRQNNRYLDIDGTTERLGPGWVDRRSRWETFADPWDLVNTLKGEPAHEKFWLRAHEWPACTDGSFAEGTASNASKSLRGKKYRSLSMKVESNGSE